MKVHNSIGVPATLAAVCLSVAGLAAPVSAIASDTQYEYQGSISSTDNADGTYSIPLFSSDVPDVSVAYVPAEENSEGRDYYYMVSTTMHLSPGAPIMKSYDLVNWEIVDYAYDRLSTGDAFSLRNGKESYGNGQWATSIRYHDGEIFILFNTNNIGGAYMYHVDENQLGSVERAAPWEKVSFGRGMHDPTLFFDPENGKPYVFYGNGNQTAVELDPDNGYAITNSYDRIFTQQEFVDGGADFARGLFEGSQLAYIDGYYYMVMITTGPAWNRQVVVLRSPYLLGRYDPAAEGEQTYEIRSGMNADGFAQGSMVPVRNGAGELDWHGFFFRDTFPLGRIPALVPATWEDGWPQFGIVDGEQVVKYGATLDHLIELPAEQAALQRTKSIVTSDDFSNDIPRQPWTYESWDVPEDVSDPQAPGEPGSESVEILTNGSFETGSVDPWIRDGNDAELAVVDTDRGSAIQVSNRAGHLDGPIQVLTDKVQAGNTYKISGWFKFDEGPDSTTFRLLVNRNGGEHDVVAQVPATKGEWTHVEGDWTMPQNASGNIRLVLATPYNDFTDFMATELSMKGIAAPVPDQATRGEVSYNGSNLAAPWEWNHAPNNKYWSLTEREGWLRLATANVTTGTAQHRGNNGPRARLEEARNTLSQRTVGPTMSAETRMDVSGMHDGDTAGIAVYHRLFSYAGVRMEGGVKTLGIVTRLDPNSTDESFIPGPTVELTDQQSEVYVKADSRVNGGVLKVQYYYSFDGDAWSPLGSEVTSSQQGWESVHFMGPRWGLFNYATEEKGGYVDFDYFYISDRLGLTVDKSQLSAAIAHATALSEAAAPDALLAVMASRAQAAAGGIEEATTQNQIDALLMPLERAMAEVEAAQSDIPEPTVVTPAAPSFADNVVTIPSVAGVVYQDGDGEPVSGAITLEPGQKLTVTAVAAEGYQLDPDAPASWEFIGRDGDVDPEPTVVTPAAPSFADNVVTIPSVAGVVYQDGDGEPVSGAITLEPGQKLTVTAVAAEGYQLDPDAPASWEFIGRDDPVPPKDKDQNKPGGDEDGKKGGDAKADRELPNTGATGPLIVVAALVALILGGGILAIFKRRF